MKKIKINVKKPINDLGGKQIVDGGQKITAGHVIAKIVDDPKPGKQLNHIKAGLIAQEMYRNEEVELDEADFRVVKDMVTEFDGFSSSIIYQTLCVLEEAYETTSSNEPDKQLD